MLASGDLLAIFLSTPSARRATHQVDHVRHIGVISIHALREEGDWVLASAMLAASIFLSTPSARRATQESEQNTSTTTYFYPRPPRGGRPIKEERALELLEISIHALREEGDTRPLASLS